MNSEEVVNKIKHFTRSDFENNLVNLHIHTTFSDGKAQASDILKQAKEKGYKLIAICDHNTIDAHKIIKDDILVSAVEFDVWCGYVFLHLLAYGIDIESCDMKPFYAKTKKETEADIVRIFSSRNIKNLIKAIHSAGGNAVLAHPACCWAINLESFVKKLISYGLDGIEVYYPYQRHRGIIKFHTAKSVEKIADKYNLIKTGGTDLHTRDL